MLILRVCWRGQQYQTKEEANNIPRYLHRLKSLYSDAENVCAVVVEVVAILRTGCCGHRWSAATQPTHCWPRDCEWTAASCLLKDNCNMLPRCHVSKGYSCVN